MITDLENAQQLSDLLILDRLGLQTYTTYLNRAQAARNAGDEDEAQFYADQADATQIAINEIHKLRDKAIAKALAEWAQLDILDFRLRVERLGLTIPAPILRDMMEEVTK